jgi:tetratricopeptide (TPR) repeat protein
LGNLGFAYASLGLYSLARSTLEQALRAEEEVGNRRARAYELQNLGEVYWRTGDHRTARRVLEESIGELAATGDRWGRALSLVYLALVLEHSGDLAGAASRYSEARDIFTAMGARALVNDALVGLARCALAQGRFDEACAQATDLWQYLTEHGSSGLDKAILAYQTCADIFDALGESERSRAAVEAGYRELMERADKISNPEWRRCFLENVSEHRAIVEMWQRVNA